MSLSEKIWKVGKKPKDWVGIKHNGVILIEDVKEFIRDLKEELKIRWVDEAKKLGEEEFTATSVGELFELFGEEIDKLAGSKLT